MIHTEYPQLIHNTDFEKWSEINESELSCIFSETGADRELDFNREDEEQVIFSRY